ncbi:RNA polymerase RPO35 [Choristoneura rosaceana entomopoxvirus 'L']|uniref:RNA polymerase RPO35 n=1 Tax=Choristoneura rosaceana entomopoxvirus 'L' TaxID=1293539 RepID=A0ABM9QK96_9POXV|nr:RNA polymerase RPO35 [Choristoneura rosaceana entomopoxvirus 'L']CCU55972.1 RNA polymerase RPO35 [Choristoneura rosaceana entomopoxvirus 'L']
MVFENIVFTYKFTSIKEKKIYQICKCINNIYDKKIRIPTLTKTIIDAKHNLGPIYLNIANMLAYVDIVYLFNNNLKNLNNCGIYLHIVDNGNKQFLTYKDIVLFIFDDDTGEIEIIKNPEHSDKHHILCLSKEKKSDDSIGSSHILLFSSNANIEENNNLHKNITNTFTNYPVKNNIKSEIQNSKHCYENNLLLKTPFSMWGMYNEDDDVYIINIRYNHYDDIDRNNIKEFFTEIFTEIADIFETTIIKKNIVDYNIKISYSDILDHKMNYKYVNVPEDDIAKNKMDALCYMNDIDGINGVYLKANDEEIIDGEFALNTIMRNTIKELLDEFLKFVDETYDRRI